MFFSINAHTQTSNSFKKDDYDINKFKLKKISIASAQANIHFANIARIEIVDARADTIAVGFMQKNMRKPVFVLLNNGLKVEAQQLINSYCMYNTNDSAVAILMVIKKLWLTDALDSKNDIYESNKIKRNDKTILSQDEDSASGIVIKLEFYLKEKMNYYALYRYDSVLRGVHSVSYYGSEFIRLGLSASLSRLISMDNSIFTIIENRRAFSLEEIRQHNSQNFDLPILKDTILKNGVYMTFEEFKNNNPSQSNFEVKKEKLLDMIYIKQPDGTEYSPRYVWGYCDGKDAFVQLFNNFFLLQKKENAFYIYGAKKLTSGGGSGGSTYIPATPGYAGQVATPGIFVPTGLGSELKLNLKPFQLDWDTGKLY